MKVSIITVSLNSEKTIEDAITSVVNQSYKDIEYIVIDGASSDSTVDIIKKHRNRIAYWVSEKDKNHYDAMNKGIKVATGHIIGILNSDDMYIDDSVIEDVVKSISKNDVDSCYGDLVYVDKHATNKVIRYWNSGSFCKERFKRGWMPPHPAFFVRRRIYEKYGYFRTDQLRAGDYELMLRLLYKFEISTVHIPRVLTKMRIGGGGKPTVANVCRAIKENYWAWKVNELRPSLFTFVLKPVSKIFQYINR